MPIKPEMSDLEKQLQDQFNPENIKRFTSTAKEPESSEYVKELVLPEESRGRLPMTRDSFLINENPALVEWERETRKFLARLNTTDFSHRITAPMVYEWVTGISIKDLAEAEGADKADGRGGGKTGSANMHLRHINTILRAYFGKPYQTKIAGRDVGRAYRVRKSFRVKHKRPECITLWPEWESGTLRP